MFNFDAVAAHQEFCDSETPELISGDEVRQAFTSLEYHLYRIELLFSANRVEGSNGTLLFALYEGRWLGRPAEVLPAPLASTTVDMFRLREGGWRSFEFSPLRNSQGRTYTIVLKVEGAGRIKLRTADGVGKHYFYRSISDNGALTYRAFAIRDFHMYKNFNILRNEMRSNNVRVAHRPVMLRLEISKVCNQKCVMCAHGQDDFRLEKFEPKNMSLDVFEKVVVPLLPTTSVLVAFGLGEPFLNKDFLAILKRAKEVNRLTHIFVSTNGTRLTDEWSRQIIQGRLIDVLQFSIDGATEETYAQIRRRAKPGNDYLNVLAALKTMVRVKQELNAHFPRIKAEMLVTKHSASEIFRYVKQMTTLGVNIIVLDSVKGEYPGLGLDECDIRTIAAELERSRAYADSTGVSIEGPLFNEVSALLSATTTPDARVH